MDPATCNVGRATPHNNLTSLTSPTTLPHLRGGVKRHSFTHVATSHMHPHFSNASIPSQPSHFPTHSTATISASAKSQDHPPERSAHFPSSRRLATTFPSLHQRSLTNRDTAPFRLPHDYKSRISIARPLTTHFSTP